MPALLRVDPAALHGRSVSVMVGSGRVVTGAPRTASGRPMAAGTHHGYKGNLLVRPLPDTSVQAEA